MGEKKQRKLTDAERARLDRFEVTCAELVEQGYTRVDLVISMVWASIVSIIGIVALFVIFLPIFCMLHPDVDPLLNGAELLIAFAIMIALIVVHELIHGLTWSRFAEHGFKDIDFGIMMNTLSPYCTCAVPLQKDSYILGALMPLIVLGVIPLIVSLVIGSIMLLYIAIIMIDAASGDIMIVIEILRHKSTASDVLLYDHPTEAGSVIFER